MKQDEAIAQLNAEFKEMIEDYVQQQDLRALETPLKTNEMLKIELKNTLNKQHNFEAISRGVFNAIDLIHDHLKFLGNPKQTNKVHQELMTAFKSLKENTLKNLEIENMSPLSAETSLWTVLYGISDETLLLIYEKVLQCYEKNEIVNAKDLLSLLLIFAPIVPSYWNALGFCYQKEEKYEMALKYYTISEQISPEILDTHFYLARCYNAMNQKSLALEQVDKIVKQLDSLKVSSNDSWRNQAEKLAQEITQ